MITNPKDKTVKTKTAVVRGRTIEDEILIEVQSDTDSRTYSPNVVDGEWSVQVELDHGTNKVREVADETIDSITIYNLEMDDLQPVYSVKTGEAMVISGYSEAGIVKLDHNGIVHKSTPNHLDYFEFRIPLPAEDDQLMLYVESGDNASEAVEVEVPEYNLEQLLTKMKEDYHMVMDTIESDVYNDQLSTSIFYTSAIRRMVAILNTLLHKRLTIPSLQSKMDQLTLYDLIYDHSVEEDSAAGSDFELTNGSPVSLSMPALPSDGDIALLVYIAGKPDEYKITISESNSTDEEVRIINPSEYSAYVLDISSVLSDPTTSSTIDLSVSTSRSLFINNNEMKSKLLLNYRGEFD